jgi:hypothetical protein
LGSRLFDARPNDEGLSDSDHLAVQVVPLLDLFHGHARTPSDHAQCVASLNDHDGRFSFRSGRSRRGEAQQCDPEHAQHPDRVY